MLPTISDKRDHLIEQVSLGRESRVKFSADTVAPPASLSVWTNAGELQLSQPMGEHRPIDKSFQSNSMQVNKSEVRTMRDGWIEYICLLPTDVYRRPRHDSPSTTPK